MVLEPLHPTQWPKESSSVRALQETIDQLKPDDFEAEDEGEDEEDLDIFKYEGVILHSILITGHSFVQSLGFTC